MGWPASIGVGALTAIVSTVLAGYVANLTVGWYRISSFEGASGYFVVGMALIGLIVGLVLGIAMSRMVAGSAHPNVFRALGLAQGAVVGLILVSGTTARLLADVPPRLDGQEMLLAVEFRWPEGEQPAAATDSSVWWLRLGSSINRTVRATTKGPLWREDARLEGGRWVVPGAVDLFTSRGRRIIDVVPDGVIRNGFEVPLPGRPGRTFIAWSEWLPHARAGQPPLADGFRYRFRVVPSSQPVRTETFGPFEVLTFANGFDEVTYGDFPATYRVYGQFEVRYRGEVVTLDAQRDSFRAANRIDEVATVNAAVPALMIRVDSPDGAGPCYLVIADGSRARIERMENCGSGLQAAPLTSDARRWAEARDRMPIAKGRVDRVTFASPGLYHFHGLVLDTRSLTVRNHSTEGQGRLIERIPPLGVSPDEQSIVRLEWAEDGDGEYQLMVDRLDNGERYRVVVDRGRTRLTDIDLLDPDWLTHYFTWQPMAGGATRLVARHPVSPLPYRGRLTKDGGYREYRVAGALEGLRGALIEWLAREFGGESLPDGGGGFSREVRVDGVTIHIGYEERDHLIGVWIDRGVDSRLVATIAERFDAELGSGRYDGLFIR